MKPPEFENLVELGRGGMGTAHLARAVGIGGFERLVVVKRLNPSLKQRADAMPRFLAEGRIAGSVHHANVVGTQQVGSDSEGLFIVLDYVEGGTLDELRDRNLLRGSPIPVPIALRVALDALAGLEAVHQALGSDGRPLSILHRDMSLQNVLVGLNDGVARISDFGIAKSALGDFQTEQGYLVGKLAYLAPEYLRREAIGPTLDLYSLGVTLWLAISGQDLWSGASEAQFIEAILGEGIPPLGRRVTVTPEVEALVARACRKDPKERFQSAREMADVIRRFDREHGWVASHAEVAAFVRELLGVDLERRRELVRAAAKKRRAVPTARRKTSDTGPTRWLSQRRALLVALPLGLVALWLGVFALGGTPVEPEVTLPASPSSGAPDAQREQLTPDPRAPDVVPDIRPVISATPGSSVAGSEESLATESAKSGAEAARSSRPKAAAPARERPAPDLRPPDEIRSKNPYR